jgi:protein ImuB
VRRELGEALQPALGWNSSKFTARAAAARCRPGQMRLVGPRDEARFLDPLPVALLPLPAAALQQLDWLGIGTLGLFGRLPAAAIRQRFGPAGLLAQRWAQGRDDRPVRATVSEAPELIEADLDGPTASRDLGLEQAMRALNAPLKAMAARLEGCRRLRLELKFADGSERRADRALAESTCQPAVLRAAIGQELRRAAWPAELSALRVALLDVAELKPGQLALFPEAEQAGDAPSPLDALANKLKRRYGPVFARAQVSDASHLAPERRFCFALVEPPP